MARVNARVAEAAARRLAVGADAGEGAQEAGRKRGAQTTALIREHHSRTGVHVCIACAAPRMAEARAVDTPPTRVAAARAKLREAEAKAAEGGGESGAATAKLKTAQRRLQEEEGKGITEADEAEALWQARCALATAPHGRETEEARAAARDATKDL